MLKQLFVEEVEFLTKFEVEGITELYRIEKTSKEVFWSNVNIFSILKIESEEFRSICVEYTSREEIEDVGNYERFVKIFHRKRWQKHENFKFSKFHHAEQIFHSALLFSKKKEVENSFQYEFRFAFTFSIHYCRLSSPYRFNYLEFMLFRSFKHGIFHIISVCENHKIPI